MGVHNADYDQIRDALGIDPSTDEPLFIIRAKDILSVPAIARYQVLAIEAELPVEFTNSLNEVLATFSEWQHENAILVKKPD